MALKPSFGLSIPISPIAASQCRAPLGFPLHSFPCCRHLVKEPRHLWG
jgi:hypothetical protein